MPAVELNAIAEHVVEVILVLKLDKGALAALPVKDAQRRSGRRDPPPEAYYLGDAVGVQVR
jgi:hypothetical protein